MPNAQPYRERLVPAPWVYVATGLVVPASLLVFLPISLPVGVLVAVGLYGAIVAVLLLTTPVVEVTADRFRAGKAQIDREFIGGAQAFQGAEATAQRGVELNARAWLLLRGWIPGLVRVELADPDDPTPYWLVASRHPEELAKALTG